ncbi:MAG TPA: hypothetical protein VKH37_05515 [Ferruginibacter sp.]|nr:hypothetical protein [Ferruginibacter sp.]
MENLGQLELTQLVDLLTVYTSDYTKMFLEKERGKEFEECKFYIDLIQNEINLRKAALDPSTTNVTDSDIEFDAEH